MGSPLTSGATRIAVFGHPSADLAGVAEVIPQSIFSVSVAHDDQLNYEFAEFAAVIVVMSASQGAPNSLIKAWDEIAEFLVPRMIVITDIEAPDADFDEAVLIARRMFGEGVTPYLVLHSDTGEPCAFIDLETLQIRDYSTGHLEIKESDEDHKTLVKEFSAEYLNAIADLEGERFATGLFVPIIPFSSQFHLGVHLGALEMMGYLNEVVEK